MNKIEGLYEVKSNKSFPFRVFEKGLDMLFLLLEGYFGP